MSAPPLHTRVALRGVVAIVVGIVVGVLSERSLGFAAALLAGWAALAVTMVVWAFIVAWPMDAQRTKEHATSEDPGRPVARVVAVVGSIASLGGLAVVLLEARHAAELQSFLLGGVAVIAVGASWALIQVDYMLEYAAVYYAAPVGGIEFNQDDDPMYSDFAYFSFGLGMTYQVADTNVRSNQIRRIVLAQTLLAYLFGAVILATVINLVTSLG